MESYNNWCMLLLWVVRLKFPMGYVLNVKINRLSSIDNISLHGFRTQSWRILVLLLVL